MGPWLGEYFIVGEHELDYANILKFELSVCHLTEERWILLKNLSIGKRNETVSFLMVYVPECKICTANIF